ncbi:MAG: DUF3784 domain-containing protein [Salibacteraceae bacterium]
MDFSIFITGGLFIVLGFLVKAFPMLLAGYNTMSKEQKKNVDIENLSSFARNCFIVLGVIIMLVEAGLKYFDITENVNAVIVPIILIGVFGMVLGAQKYDRN